jgi:imidazolonepropionase
MNHPALDDLMIVNICEAMTFQPLVTESRFSNIKDCDLGRVKNSWIKISRGVIEAVGTGTPPSKYSGAPVMDAQGGVALPGLVDCHTHPVFLGRRSHEFCMRLEGKTYQEIAQQGGGIQSTVRTTSESSTPELDSAVKRNLAQFLAHGVTTIEAKSGYGLSIVEEIRHLEILTKIAETFPGTIYRTCLALHAVPVNEAGPSEWSDKCKRELLPIIAKRKLANAVDAFIENGYFLRSDCESYLLEAKKLGLHVRLHADEFSDSGGASLAADLGALSADHLQFASSDGLKKMSEAQVVAVLLPGTSLYTSIPYTDGRRLAQAGCPVAIATDFNPGSSPVDNLRFALTLGALHCKLSMPEALAAVTWVPAKALGLHKSKGALAPGMDADILILPLKSAEDVVADLGRAKPTAVICKGKRLMEESYQ